MIAIVDIDETVANNRHRAHLVEGEKRDWKAFLAPELVSKDTPIPRAKEGLAHLRKAGWNIIFLTGRNEILRTTTSMWLDEHLGAGEAAWNEHLIMRPDGEYSKATDYKGRELRKLTTKHASHTGPDGSVRVPFLYIDDDKFMWPVAESLGAIVLRAPHCWEHIAPHPGELPEELHWRK